MKKYLRELKKFIYRHQIEICIGFIFLVTCIVCACLFKKWWIILCFIPILLVIIFNDYVIKFIKKVFKIKEKEITNIDMDLLINEEVKEIKDAEIEGSAEDMSKKRKKNTSTTPKKN